MAWIEKLGGYITVINARPTMARRIAAAQEKLHGETLPTAWERVAAADARIEKQARQEKLREEEAEMLEVLTELRLQETREKERLAQQELIIQSNTIALGQKYPLDELHDIMQRRGEGPRAAREELFRQIYEHDHPRQPRPGWGFFRNQTRDQMIADAQNLVRDTAAAALDCSYSSVIPEYWESILCDRGEE